MTEKTPLYHEDIAVGSPVPELAKGPLTTAHIMRWSAAMENWHRIHYDHPFATQHDGLPDVILSGSCKQQFLAQMLKDWVGLDGWVWKLSFQHRAMTLPGETLTAWGVVTDKHEKNGFGIVECDIGLKNQDGVEACPGRATVVVPLRGARPVPYPFDPKALGLA